MAKKKSIRIRLGSVYFNDPKRGTIHITFLDRKANWAGFTHFVNGKNRSPRDGASIKDLRELLEKNGYFYSHLYLGC